MMSTVESQWVPPTSRTSWHLVRSHSFQSWECENTMAGWTVENGYGNSDRPTRQSLQVHAIGIWVEQTQTSYSLTSLSQKNNPAWWVVCLSSHNIKLMLPTIILTWFLLVRFCRFVEDFSPRPLSDWFASPHLLPPQVTLTDEICGSPSRLVSHLQIFKGGWCFLGSIVVYGYIMLYQLYQSKNTACTFSWKITHHGVLM